MIPARNEAGVLPDALRALSAQQSPECIREVIVLANNCSDDTAACARAVAASAGAAAIHVVEVAWPATLANVGRARRALLDIAAARVAASCPDDGFVVSTDADTIVDAGWLAATIASLDAGADAVGGRIVVDTDRTLPPATRRLMRLDDVYRRWRARLESLVDPDPADPWPRHHQHFGASLAIRVPAYRALDAEPLVPYLEDEALVQALLRRDRAVRHCPLVQVRTSARFDGRAEVGLSWQLRVWSDCAADGALPAVADPDDEIRVWQQRRRAREVWCAARAAAPGDAAAVRRAVSAVAADLGLPARWLRGRYTDGVWFGALWDAIEQRRAAQPRPTLPLDQALVALRGALRERRASMLR